LFVDVEEALAQLPASRDSGTLQRDWHVSYFKDEHCCKYASDRSNRLAVIAVAADGQIADKGIDKPFRDSRMGAEERTNGGRRRGP
jgi:predicted helicase